MKQFLFSLLLLIGFTKNFAQTATDLSIHDTRSTNLPPLSYSTYPGHAGLFMKTRFDFKDRNVIGVPGSGFFSTLMTMPQWPDNSGDKMHQLNFNNGGIFYRQGWPSATSWENWQKLVVENENGKVGIGTTTPQTMLNINLGAGDANIGSAALRIGGTGNYPSIELGVKGAYDGMISTFGNDLHIYSGNWRSNGATASENHSISFYTSEAGSTNWNTPKMFLNHQGNVGIGTASPSAKLEVKGEGTTTRFTSANTYSDLILVNSSGYGFIGSYGTSLGFFAGQGSSQDMTIKQGGNVGIGTTTPSEKLSVNGNIRAKKLIVSQQNWSDYVFYKGYKLRPLHEVEKYIQQYQHLPEVPSAKEVQAKGISVGDTQALLLKKIEELTLYMIEIKKQQEIFNKQIKTLKRENEIFKRKLIK